MGVQITNILPKKQIEMKELLGKKIAIDAFNWIYQFLSIIRDRETGEPLKDSKGRVTSHLSGLFYRTSKLMEAGIRPVYVFDGKPPEFKFAIRERLERKNEARWKLMKAVEDEDVESIRKLSQQTSRLNDEMIEQSKNLLRYMGIPVIQAPSEGEAQCAFLCRENLVFSTASQDSDSLLFGSPRLIKNLSITGKRKLPKQDVYIEIQPELIELKDIEKMGLKREQLIIMGLLVGSDFNPGIKGIGPKRALDLVKKEKTLQNVLKSVEWNHEIPAEKIYDFYLNPPLDKKVQIKFEGIEEEKIMNIMVDEHEFSKERIEKVVKNLKEKKQTSLGSWLK